MHSPSKFKKSTYIAKETPVEFSSGKKKSSMIMTRSKRQKVEKGDHIELKLTWEEAQGFLLPPPNLTPSRVVIEEYEFEEYEVHMFFCFTNLHMWSMPLKNLITLFFSL